VGSTGAAIGSGEAFDGATTTVGSIVIEQSDVSATANGQFPALGAGSTTGGVSSVADITVRSSTLSIVGGIGIGSATGATLDSVTFGGVITLNCAASTSPCINAPRLALSGTTLKVTTNTTTITAPNWSPASDFTGFDLWGQYTVMSYRDGFSNAPLIHIGQLLDGIGTNPQLKVAERDYQAQALTGFAVSVSGPGSYRITANGSPLCHDGSQKDFVVADGELFVTSAGKCTLSAGAIAGIVVGVVVGVGLVVVGVYLFVRFKGCPRKSSPWNALSAAEVQA
jgi:hypothetical protein